MSKRAETLGQKRLADELRNAARSVDSKGDFVDRDKVDFSTIDNMEKKILLNMEEIS